MIDIGMFWGKIQDYLNDQRVVLEKTSFGYAALKCNYPPSKGTDGVIISGLKLNLVGKILHESVLVFDGEIPIRSHQEVFQEVVKNIGDVEVFQTLPQGIERKISLGEGIYSVNSEEGFYHGFKVIEGVGLLYVAKALDTRFAIGNNSFKIPKNTYNPARDLCEAVS